jgi:hypothetical protein
MTGAVSMRKTSRWNKQKESKQEERDQEECKQDRRTSKISI